MSSFGDMLGYLRKREKLSQSELAKKIGISRSAIGMYEAGEREPSFEILEALADIFNVNMDTLLGKTYGINSLPVEMLPLPKMKEWTVLGATACGTPLHRETYDETIMAPEDIKADVVFRCVGDSMINARIFDGDAVFIRLQPSVDNGQIAVVRLDDEYTLKRVYMGDGYVELRAENPTFPTIILRGAELEAKNFAVIGLAVTFLSHVR